MGNIHTKLFFGYSEYRSGQRGVVIDGGILRSFNCLRNVVGGIDEGVVNITDFAIGTHIYGSNNDIRLTGDITSGGRHCAGMRIEGVGNFINVSGNIELRGIDGNGIWVSYGRRS
jgi:hypothetical protein